MVILGTGEEGEDALVHSTEPSNVASATTK
jgi:hypothetical protein